MGGGIIQLTSLGTQDNYLISNPQYSFFKAVYRRHTNFSIESVQQTFDKHVKVESTTVTSKIANIGDLIYHTWLDISLFKEGFSISEGQEEDTYVAWTNGTGYAFIKEYELKIGGQKIDKHYSSWLDIYNELTDHDDREWIGANKHASKSLYLESSLTLPNLKLYIPLKFWFCRKVALALPLIALQYHDVEISFTTRNVNTLINTNANTGSATPITKDPELNLWVDYIHLDNDERRRFAQNSHEYLIEQVQMEEYPAKTNLLQTVNFNHPVKELIWVIQKNNVKEEKEFKANVSNIDATLNSDITLVNSNDYFCYQSTEDNIEEFYGIEQKENFSTFRLLINGIDRFPERKASYFRLCQPIQAGHSLSTKHIYMYSFSLKPEEYQPSGTCNFSRINDIKMSFTGTMNNSTLTVYAVNYNILRIKSGMGGIVFTGNPRVVKKKVKTQKRSVRGRRKG